MRSKKSLLPTGVVIVVSFATTAAMAGGFGLREQSTVGQGDAFAGVAAGGSLSSMFWNPATLTQTPGRAIEEDGTGFLSNVTQHAGAGSTLSAFGLGGADNTGSPALTASGYSSWQINSNLWLGLSINSPFGLATSFPDQWAGRNYALSTSLATYNATPSVAYSINDWLSVGFGVQIQYARADLNLGLAVPTAAGPGSHLNLNGNGWGYGFTAGVTVKPTPNTTIGLGWRSAVDQKINGNLALDPVPAFSTPGAANTTLDLPDIVSLGIRHKFDDRWSLLGTVEWTNWSRIGTSAVNQGGGGAAIIGGSPVTLPFQYRDGWFYSAGVEYVLNPKVTFRAGAAYESSPITDQVRMPILPDNDRIWLSAGMSYKVLPNLIMDLGYTHIWVKDANINISATSGNPWFNPAVPIALVGDASVGIDIFSFGFRYMFDTPPTALITKG